MPIISFFPPYRLILNFNAPCSYELAEQYWFIDHPPLEKLAWEQKQMYEKNGQSHWLYNHKQTCSCDLAFPYFVTRNAASSQSCPFYLFCTLMQKAQWVLLVKRHTCHHQLSSTEDCCLPTRIAFLPTLIFWQLFSSMCYNCVLQLHTHA